MSHLFTASALARIAACQASLWLPSANRQSDDAERGTGGHRYLQLIAEGRRKAEALAAVSDEHRDECASIDTAAVFSGLTNLRAEVAYAIDVETGGVRLLGTGLERRYVCGENEVPGTVDLVATDIMSDTPVVVDFKLGWNDVAPPADNLQVAFAAYCAAAESGADEVEGRITYVRGGKPRVERHTFDGFELEGFLERLRAIHAAAKAARGSRHFVPGDHCRYCPGLASCDAQTGLVRDMLPVLDDAKTRLPMMTPEQAGEAWQKLAKIEQLAALVKEGLKSMARATPLPLPNGQVVREVASTSTSFSKAAALELLRKRGATEDEIEGLTKRVATTQVRAVARRK